MSWIGIDLGTTHSSVAVWDSTRGNAKWIRIASPSEKGGKRRRLIPSHALLAESTTVDGEYIVPMRDYSLILGYEAQKILQNHPELSQSSCYLASIKRLLTQGDNTWNATPVDCSTEQASTKNEALTTDELLVAILSSLRSAANVYLLLNMRKKHLQVPGSDSDCLHAVIGVPASYSQQKRNQLIQTAQKAGFQTAHVIIESTAAALTYGLGVSDKQCNIMVIDVGGGTTDVSILERNAQGMQVLVTEGDLRLGGDDMDAALQQFLHKKGVHVPILECQRIKEELCTKDDPDCVASSEFGDVQASDFEQAIAPLVERIRQVVRSSLEQWKSKNDLSVRIDEVVLIGGTTRVPKLWHMLQEEFPDRELCTSVNPMSAVAQGCAIQAAILSDKVPQHELESALMLDSTPHAIGVEAADGTFVEVIPKDTPLPAKGDAPFDLAEISQKGITVRAVERIGTNDSQQIVEIGVFNFLLHHIEEQVAKRTIRIGMMLDTSGAFRVDIFDELDPEHVTRREASKVGASADLSMEWSAEQIPLIVGCIVLVFMYIAVKILLVDVEAKYNLTAAEEL